jgi:PAS domain S-box-containing protein/diguanylate cyclase (GGDEF)-like protein
MGQDEHVTDAGAAAPADADRSWRRFLPHEGGPPEMMYETDLQGRITWASPSTHEVLGWTSDQLIGTSARALFHPHELERIDGLRAQFYQHRDEYQQISCLLRCKSGAYRALSLGARPMVEADGSVVGAIVHIVDTHDRDFVLRALATLSQANRTLVRARDEAVLLQEMCQTIVSTGRYLFAWYGRPVDDPEQSVPPIAQAGQSDGYLDEVRISWGDNPFGHGPTGKSIRLRQTEVSNDQDVDPDFAPWLEPARRRGFRSSISLPVFVDDALDGALVAYAAEPHAFDAQARELLEDLAADLGYGMQRLRAVNERDEAVHRLVESEQQFRLLAENSSDVIMLSRPDMTVTWVSPSVQAAFGYSPEAVVGRNADFLIHPDDLPAVVAEVIRTDADMTNLHIRHRLVHADGRAFWVDVAAGHIDDDGTGQPGRVVSIRDVDAEVRADRELAAREAQFRLLAENASDIVWQASDSGQVTWVSPSITTVLGWDADDVIGSMGANLIHPDDRETLQVAGVDSPAAGRAQGEVRLLSKDGSWQWMSVTIASVSGPDAVTRIVSMRNIHEEVLARQRLEHALGHDQLTGLPTLRVLVDRIRQRQADLTKFHVVGVLSIGVDGLSAVNEALTHAAGDVLLTTVAARIVAALDHTTILGRGSGNELVVVAPDLRTGAVASTLAEQVRTAAQGPISIAGQPMSPTVTIGIATGGSDADPEQLVRDASLALRKAKDNGGDRFEFADPGLAIEAQHRLTLDHAIREGVAEGSFVPWYQPIVDLATGRIVGFEALARWQRPGSTAQPSSFLSIAEQSSLISSIDTTVAAQAIRTLSRLPESMHIAVNVSAATLGRLDYAEQVTRALATARTDPRRLHIEVTESMLLDPNEAVVASITRLADLGVKWYIDDFGTGYASITSLRDLPMSGLKLDRTFTYGITSQDRTATQLAQALVGLAEGLELDTVAEGIETHAQADYLRTLGWRHGQGWLFGKAAPVPAI